MTNLLITLVLILVIVVIAKMIRVYKLSSELSGVDPSIVSKNYPNSDKVRLPLV